ncbi:NRT1-PTR FAMILY 4-6 protein [Nymphaea thermarum]|nr:NRT1-PTR FAMILY 4-6 protein [Nymphaea thermarum]
MEEAQVSEKWEGYVDWRNRPAHRSRHGGMLAASFVLVVEVLENLAFLANASNLVMYMVKFMHFEPAKAANAVTNFMGTAFLLALLGGFLSDAFLTTYHTYLLSALVEFCGLVLLTVQARLPSLRPPPCHLADPNSQCQAAGGKEIAALFSGLYLVALGVGGIKGSLPSHGAHQFDENDKQGRKQRSTFFNYFVFCLSCGGLIAVTFVVWVEDNKGWQWGFGISTLSILLSVPVFLAGSRLYRNKMPDGSPLTTIAKVVLGAIFSCKGDNAVTNSPGPYEMQSCESPTDGKGNELDREKTRCQSDTTALTGSLRFLNRATLARFPIPASTAGEVEDVKSVVRIVPIFASTIMLNCCLAQLSTFSVQQAATMDTRIGRLPVPPASLPIFPVVFIMVLAPLYDHAIVPLARRLTGSESGISHLRRIGTGLVLSIIAMAAAALVEVHRKRVARRLGLLETSGPLPETFLWIAIQYLFLGSADLFTLAGLLEFFFTEAPESMRSLATSLSWASLAVGYYLSSVLVSIINRATGGSGRTPWLAGKSINHFHLERFYWLMCALSATNFLHFLFWAVRYRYKRAIQQRSEGGK